MLRCKACMRRCIRTVFADLLQRHRPPPPLLWTARLFPQPPLCLRRGHATEAIPFDNPTASPSPSLDVGVRTPYVIRPNRPTKPDEPFSKTSLEQEVRWLRDPLKLGDHTVSLLRQDQFVKALAIVRRVSKDMECTVSWNHLVDYEMSKGKVADAVKLYNEMKKRAQIPDAHTFTTLFRGLSWHPKFPLSVSRALSIYHSMFADNSPVRPSIIHTNAVLKVCALAGDMDALLGVAAKLSARGRSAADSVTYTTILNAIRNDTWEAVREGKASGEKEKQAMIQGRKLWEEIRERWANGDLRLDEELVCAMGRLMIAGNKEKHCDDILSLVEQTMGLRRQVPRIGDPSRRISQRSHNAFDGPVDPHLTSLDEMVPTVPRDSLDLDEDSSHPESDPFAPLPNGPPKPEDAIRPGRNTLSLILDACIRAHLHRAAQNYWGLLTDRSGPYNITPDSENYHMYLRLLRAQRGSKLAVELIDEMSRGTLGPKVALQTKTFRIALSCCVRDKLNKNSLSYASKLVGLMNDTLPNPDARVLIMYLRLALAQDPLEWRTLMGVIRSTELGVKNLKSLLAYDPEGRQNEEDLRELVRTLKGAIHIALDIGNEEMPEEEKRRCKEQRHMQDAWITRMANKDRSIRDQGKGGERYLKNREYRQGRFIGGEIELAHEGSTIQWEGRTRSERRKGGERYSKDRENRQERFMGGETEIAHERDSEVTYEGRAGNRRAEEERRSGRQRGRKRMSDRNLAFAWKRFVDEDEKIDGGMGRG